MSITVDNPGPIGRLRVCAAVTGVFLLLTDAVPAEPDGEAMQKRWQAPACRRHPAILAALERTICRSNG